MHLKHGYCMLIHFIHGYYCIYRPWQPLTYLYFPYCISFIYFSFTKIRMFLYARIYWLAEFGDVSCLQFNYLRVETLTPTWEDFVRHLSDNFKSEIWQNSVSDLRVWSLIHLEGSVSHLASIWLFIHKLSSGNQFWTDERHLLTLRSPLWRSVGGQKKLWEIKAYY